MAKHEGFYIHLVQDNLILSPKSKPQDFLIFEIGNCFSNMYSRNLSIEVSSKMREKAEQGYYSSRAMVGYKTERIAKRSYLKIDDEKAPFVKDVFELYATGQYSYESLAAEMRRRKFMISNCVECGKSNIEDILNNPVYMGDFMWDGIRYYNGKHEPIVSRELYNFCQRIIKEKTSTDSVLIVNNIKNQEADINPFLVKIIAKSYYWNKLIDDGKVKSSRDKVPFS